MNDSRRRTSRRAIVQRPLALALLSLVAATPAMAETAPALAPSAQATGFIGTAINVTDRERSVRFYAQGLGFTVAATLPLGSRSETILRLPGDAAQASLLLMHDPSPAAPKVLDQGNGFSRLVLRVGDLAALATRLTELGYPHGEIRESGQQGYRIMMMTDPDGYRLELVQQIPPGPRS